MGETLSAAREAKQESTERATALQEILQRAAAYLTVAALVMSVIGASLGLFKKQRWQDVVLTGLSLAFATIPEELPIITAAVLAVGARSLSKKRVFVKRIRAMENLAFVDVLLSDKTGTLTMNRMQLRKIVVGRSVGVDDAATAGAATADDRHTELRTAPRHRRLQSDMLQPSQRTDYRSLMEAWALMAEEAEDLVPSVAVRGATTHALAASYSSEWPPRGGSGNTKAAQHRPQSATPQHTSLAMDGTQVAGAAKIDGDGPSGGAGHRLRPGHRHSRSRSIAAVRASNAFLLSPRATVGQPEATNSRKVQFQGDDDIDAAINDVLSPASKPQGTAPASLHRLRRDDYYLESKSTTPPVSQSKSWAEVDCEKLADSVDDADFDYEHAQQRPYPVVQNKKLPAPSDPYDYAVSFLLGATADRARYRAARGILTGWEYSRDYPFESSAKMAGRLFSRRKVRGEAIDTADADYEDEGEGAGSSMLLASLLKQSHVGVSVSQAAGQPTSETSRPQHVSERSAHVPSISRAQWMFVLKGATDAVLGRCEHVMINGRQVNLDACISDATKGAPQRLRNGPDLTHGCHVAGGAVNQQTHKQLILEELGLLAAAGLRTVAFACTISESDREPSGILDIPTHSTTFLGFFCFEDPLRKEVPAAVADCRAAGIQVVMVTGDHPLTAAAIARKCGILEPGKVTSPAVCEISGTAREDDAVPAGVVHCGQAQAQATDQRWHLEVRHQRVEPWALSAVQADARVFARAIPLHKLQLVNAYRDQGHVIAVTGDGVNDAPALAEADVGMAVRDATDVAKEACAIVVVNESFQAIVASIREGRRLFDNLINALAFYLAAKLGLVILFISATVWRGFPLTPLQIIVLELFLDVGASTSFVAEPSIPDIMRRPPRSKAQGIFGWVMIARIIAGGLSAAACVLGGFAYGLAHPHCPDPAPVPCDETVSGRSMAFACWLMGHVLLAVNMRTVAQPVTLFKGLTTNRALLVWAGSVAALVGLAGGVHAVASTLQLQQLAPREWGVALLIAVSATCWLEIVKIIMTLTPIKRTNFYRSLLGFRDEPSNIQQSDSDVEAGVARTAGGAEFEVTADAETERRIPRPRSSSSGSGIESRRRAAFQGAQAGGKRGFFWPFRRHKHGRARGGNGRGDVTSASAEVCNQYYAMPDE